MRRLLALSFTVFAVGCTQSHGYECLTTADCPRGALCVNNLCEGLDAALRIDAGACQSDGQCPPGSVCVNERCEVRADGGACECTPGSTETERQACGSCGSQERARTCEGSCRWGAWSEYGECEAAPLCTPGQSETVACGNCGTQVRTCTDECDWGEPTACTGEGTCAPGAAEVTGCGRCGTRTTTCTESCVWGSPDACSGEGV